MPYEASVPSVSGHRPRQAYVFCLCAVRRRGNVEELALGRPGSELLNREHYAYYVRNIL
jgi:hypothetical protein